MMIFLSEVHRKPIINYYKGIMSDREMNLGVLIIIRLGAIIMRIK